ncbi:diguanylate cyclase [Xanthomonas campestris]|jgi:diguanylate cyclase (GGDEF)-like protein|uniref:diguanylate cyclase n=3 Tax=Xanthomonas campestris pv. campestris TaxID=340 RepID=Q8PB32_XANCP|nr:diguanylate cyclase [Xanthomonas campestris]AAM40592.1 sensor histidine kinase [Xanthomonas campestris pv. campestris str. ATCC 33913]AAY49994.1 sensor histidine kinase [Xanthomonas campestris pv. campestris str. 8004]AKS16902.1 histidine kinase [Xanthomonas campestris pv. campestris]AKS20917.1 histidine kinase [Xanthomonas campestris pv. campestris]ALE68155.1 histidine kinase [Xanthomonas campestris pv. campestris]
MPSSFTSRRRNQLALVFSALIFIAIGIGIFIGARRSLADAALVSHTHEVIGRVDEIQARVLDAESAERGYLLTGNDAYLLDYQTSVERLPILIGNLRRKIADNPSQVAHLDQLHHLVDTRLKQIQHVLDVYADSGLEPARTSIRQTAFRTTSVIREQALTMVQREQELLALRAESSRQSALLLLILALAGIPLGLAVVGTVYGLLMRELRHRAQAERHAARANQELGESIGALQRSAADLNLLSRYTGLLQSCVSAEEALDVTSRTLAHLLPGIAGSVYLLRASQDRAEVISHWGTPLVHSASHLLPEECWALRRGQPHLIEDLARDAPCAHIDLPDASVAITTACLPMSAQGTQLGFLFLSAPGPAPMPRLEIAEAAAEQLSLALSNLRLRESLRRQSIRDALTGLYNRRYLEEALSHELARCARRDLPLSVLMLDVDHFKQFNDGQGHAGGDLLLAAVGELLLTRLRAEDVACRYGGEEFTVILPETDGEEAMRVAEQIRGHIAALAVSDGQRALPRVTASIGVASFPADGELGSALIQKADAALYVAKRQGRNRVERHGAVAVNAEPVGTNGAIV